MTAFDTWLSQLKSDKQRERAQEVFSWMQAHYPQLIPEIKWNQPMYTAHDTFILGFSAARAHLAIAPERACLDRYREELEQAGYTCTKELLLIRWEQPLPYTFLARMVETNLRDKETQHTFWRK